MSVKLVKDCIIARSGIYTYRNVEVRGLGLSLDGMEAKDTYNVYRPPLVIEASKGLFTRLPITHEHPSEDVSSHNFRKLAIGFTGDTSQVAYDENTDEVLLKSTVALMDDEALNLYNSGIVEVSPGYMGVWQWKKGVAKDGTPYDIIMTDVKDVNHLAITRAARGGKTVKILDSAKEVKVKKLMTGLWRTIRKTIGIAKDSDLASFRGVIEDVVATRGSLSDEDISSKLGALQSTINDLPDTPEKEKLSMYLQDFALVKDKDDEQAKAYGSILSNLYEKLDSEAIETMDTKEENMENPVAEKKEEGVSLPAETQDVAVAEKPKVEYTLADVMAAFKELMSMVTAPSSKADETPNPAKDEAFAGKETPEEEKAEAEVEKKAEAEVEGKKKEPVKEEVGEGKDSIINVAISDSKRSSELDFVRQLCSR